MTILHFFTSLIKRKFNTVLYCTKTVQYNILSLEIASIKLIKHQVMLIRKSVKRSKVISSFKDAFIIPINNAPRFFLIWLLDWTFHNMDQSNKYVFYMLGLFCFPRHNTFPNIILTILKFYHSIFCMLGTSVCLSNETNNSIFLHSS